MAKHRAAPSWRLVGTVPEGTFCHKPCTVSGGGKSEISKSLVDADPARVVLRAELRRGHGAGRGDLRAGRATTRAPGRPTPLARALARLGDQAADARVRPSSRPSTTPGWRASPTTSARWCSSSSASTGPEWGDDWREPLQRRHHQRRARATSSSTRAGGWSANYLRIGREENGAWRTYKLRQDFVAADKVQMEDDITASVVVPARRLVGLPGEYDGHPEPQAGAELRVPAVPAARRRDPSAGSTARPRRTWRAPGSSAPTSSRSRPSRCQRDRRGRGRCTTPSPRRCATHVARNAARDDGGYSICSARPAADRRQAHQEPALPAGAAGPGAPARPLRGGDGRPARPPAAAPRAGAASR